MRLGQREKSLESGDTSGRLTGNTVAGLSREEALVYLGPDLSCSTSRPGGYQLRNTHGGID